jgi:calmodulin
VFDKDGNGKISKMEFREAMMQRGERMSEDEVKLMFQEFDKNNDGFFDYREFVQYMSRV